MKFVLVGVQTMLYQESEKLSVAFQVYGKALLHFWCAMSVQTNDSRLLTSAFTEQSSLFLSLIQYLLLPDVIPAFCIEVCNRVSLLICCSESMGLRSLDSLCSGNKINFKLTAALQCLQCQGFIYYSLLFQYSLSNIVIKLFYDLNYTQRKSSSTEFIPEEMLFI